MNQADTTISQCINIVDIRRGREWVHVDDPQKRFTTVVAELGRECREWREGRTNAAIEALIYIYNLGTLFVCLSVRDNLSHLKSHLHEILAQYVFWANLKHMKSDF